MGMALQTKSNPAPAKPVSPPGKMKKAKPKESYGKRLWQNILQNKGLYLMLLPMVLYYLVFYYQPMYGLQIAFKDFSFAKGIMGSPWVGFKHFADFFSSHYFTRLLRNTLMISINDLVWGFPAPIILAIMINELISQRYKKAVQSLTYLPHFISLVVVCSMVKDFLSINGGINNILGTFGIDPINFFAHGEYFTPIYVVSNMWQHLGWGSIIYLAALTNIDPQLYEAAKIDGAGKMRQIWSVTLPSILPTIIIMFILRTGKILSVGSEKVLLLYNPTIYEYSDIISTFVYRKGLEDANYSYAAAVGLFNAVINFILLYSINRVSKKVSDSSLW